MTRPRRGTLRLTLDCDNACLFCAQAGSETVAGVEELDLDEARARLAALREDFEEISFIGGEPSLDARLPELVAHARSLDFQAVGLQSNGRRLGADDRLFDDLIAAGLSDLHLSIHAPSAAAHDYHTGREGSLAASLDLLTRAERAGLSCVVATVVTRSNFRELAKMPPALKRRGVAAWLVEILRPYGRACDNFARLAPRFGMALPFALHALEQARRHGLSAWIRGAPLCSLGPFAKLALDDAPRSYAEVCGSCPARPRCPGVDRNYLEVFGARELRAVAAAPAPAFDEGRHSLMRMFVGVGELVDKAPVLYTRERGAPELDAEDEREEPGGKNRRLPILANAGPREAKSQES